MIVRHMVGLAEAELGIAAGVRAAEQDGRPMSFAVADSDGFLIAVLRMDESHPRILQHAIRKAYTAGFMHRGTLEFKAQLAERDSNLGDWGDSRLTTLPGGLPIRFRGEVVGAVGAGGNALERDQAICRIAVDAIEASL